MSAFSLSETADAAVCWYNSLNHARDERHLRLIFSCVARYLAPSAPFLFDVILPEDYLHSWKSHEYVLSAEGLYELQYRYRPEARVATCHVRVRSRLNSESVQAEAVSEQRPLDSSVIHRALQSAGFRVVFQEGLGQTNLPAGRLLVCATTLNSERG